LNCTHNLAKRWKARGKRGSFKKVSEIWRLTDSTLRVTPMRFGELWAHVRDNAAEEDVELRSDETYRRYLRLYERMGLIKRVKKGVYIRNYDLDWILLHELHLMGGVTDENKERLKARISTIIDKFGSPPSAVITSY